MFKIPYVNLSLQWKTERDELLPIIENVLASGQYIGGEIVERFEKKAAEVCGTKFCVALNSGTDALVAGLVALGVRAGDEVITPPNSFIASTAAIAHLRAIPKFVDVLPDQNIDPELIKKAITAKTKAIMPVHLTGRLAAMDEIMRIADSHGIPVIEDAAQSIGSKYSNKPSGSFGKVGCFSTHPLKNLNACGDGGFLSTNDESIANEIKKVRNHGLIDRNTVECFGYVSRMDSLQAAILEFRIANLDMVTKNRRENAKLYREMIHRDSVFIPEEIPQEFNTYHTFVIQCERRDELKEFLASKGIETSIHYPIPIHLQPASKNFGHKLGDFPVVESQAKRILTLPVNQYLVKEDIAYVAETVNSFYKK